MSAKLFREVRIMIALPVIQLSEPRAIPDDADSGTPFKGGGVGANCDASAERDPKHVGDLIVRGPEQLELHPGVVRLAPSRHLVTFAPLVRPTPQSDPWRHDRGRIVS